MNFLQLCQKTRVECGIAGNSAGDTPVAVTGQVGELLRVVNWVADAYEDIQLKNRQWSFMRKSGNVTTVIGTAIYLPSVFTFTDFADWKLDSMKIYLSTPNNEQELRYLPWDDFRATRLFGALATQTGRPFIFTIQPDRALRLWPIPDQAYTVTGEYFRTPAVMAANDDTPIFDRHHKAIVYNAMMRYASWTGEPSLYAQGQKEYGRLINKLENLYLPKFKTDFSLFR